MPWREEVCLQLATFILYPHVQVKSARSLCSGASAFRTGRAFALRTSAVFSSRRAVTAVAAVSVEDKVVIASSCSGENQGVKARQAFACNRACMHACKLCIMCSFWEERLDRWLERWLVHGHLQKKAIRSAKDKIKDVILSKNCNPIVVRLAVGAPPPACSLGVHGRLATFLG